MSTIANSGDALSRMVRDPKRYFEEARTRAAAQVDAEIKRSKRRQSSNPSDKSTTSEQVQNNSTQEGAGAR